MNMLLSILASPEAPIACDMTAAEDTLAQRLAEYRRLFDHALVQRESTESRTTFRLADRPGVRDWVLDLVRREAACCRFLSYGGGGRGGSHCCCLTAARVNVAGTLKRIHGRNGLDRIRCRDGDHGSGQRPGSATSAHRSPARTAAPTKGRTCFSRAHFVTASGPHARPAQRRASPGPVQPGRGQEVEAQGVRRPDQGCCRVQLVLRLGSPNQRMVTFHAPVPTYPQRRRCRGPGPPPPRRLR